MQRVKRFIAALGAVLLTAGVVVVMDASPAAAAYSSCPVNSLCVYQDAGGTGNSWTYSSIYIGQNCVNVTASMNDRLSSAYNHYNGTSHVTFYAGYNCADESCGVGGLYDRTDLWPGVTVTFGSNAWPWCHLNDKVSSIRFWW